MGEAIRRRESNAVPSDAIPAVLRTVELAVPLWSSDALGLVVVDRMAMVLAASPSVTQMAGSLVGLHLDELLPEDHRRRLMIAVATADGGWTDHSIGFAPDERGVPRDMIFRLHAISPLEVVILIEPALAVQREVIEHLAGMVDELLAEQTARSPD